MRPRAWNSTLPQREKGLRRGKGLRAASGPGAREPGRDTGFPPAVRLAIRTRAGNGDPGNAACEACAVWLGENGGQIQHIYARGIGGSALWLYSSAANGALLCGTRYTGCHGLCEDRDEHMEAMGFWRRRNGQEKPGDYPVMLHGEGGGVAAYLTPGGTYSFQPPGRQAGDAA